MTEYLRSLLYSQSSIPIDELYDRLKPFMYIPEQEVAVEVVALPDVSAIALPDVSAVALPEPIITIPPVKPPAPKPVPVNIGFSSILWCAYTIANGGTELNIPQALIAREERIIREDCVNRVTPAAVKQRFGFLTLGQIQTLLQEVQMYNLTKHKVVESPATWYIWATYYGDRFPTVYLAYSNIQLHIRGKEEGDAVKVLYDKSEEKYKVKLKRDCMEEETGVQVVNLLKPINGVGSYTISDLKQMAQQLDVQVEAGTKKNVLYERITEYIRGAIPAAV
jgi:hypothetical protein